MSEVVEIKGGAGPAEAAAIAAVVAAIELEEAASMSRPALPPRQSAWVQSSRPRDTHAPLPSHIYDAEPWMGAEDEPPL